MDYLREIHLRHRAARMGQGLDTWITSWHLLTEKLGLCSPHRPWMSSEDLHS